MINLYQWGIYQGNRSRVNLRLMRQSREYAEGVRLGLELLLYDISVGPPECHSVDDELESGKHECRDTRG